ncbi:MAG: gliding motility-associated ABC transporter ATP-binding subunit GldA [Flavobacteriales bacterium]|jgi:ABC-2 type transport system ATP-binding protein|nr:gliding motility-associated ABC transporter ATP-binding subunit GldA [Flavobacteriales bacterium]
MSIEVQSVSKKYGTQQVLDDISFTVKSGEIVGFLGPNGAGKSTTMKILTSYISQDQGKVAICGKDNIKNPIELKKHIGYLPEHNPLYLEMYVKEYLSFIANMYHIPKSRVDEMIEKTGLTKEYRKKIQSLSKGYRQRVGLAQALIHNPDVVILDEPTTGLDPNQLVEIRELIKEVGKEKTVLLSTHIMQEVEAICERVIIINQGKIVADANTQELKNLNSAQHTLTLELNREVSRSYFEKLHGIHKIDQLNQNEFRLHYDANQEIRKDLFNLIAQNGDYFHHLEINENNLEDVFHQLTQ